MEEDHVDDGNRHRAWVFTRNNYTEDCINAVYALSLSSEGGACAKEIGEVCQTPHLQGCVCFPQAQAPKSWKQVCEMLPDFWVKAKSKNSRFDQMWNYCLKGTQPKVQWVEHGTDGADYGRDADAFVWGTCPADNRREDANTRAARNLALCKKRMIGDMDASIVALQLRNYEYGAKRLRAIEVAAEIVRLPGERGEIHEWHYGPPGCGKSYYCLHSKKGTIYKHEAVDKWWDDYDYEPNIIFDDVDESQTRNVARFKHMLDLEPFRVQVKGGSMNIRPKCVMISSNVHPSAVWGGVHLDAILDRLGDRIYEWRQSRFLMDCDGNYVKDYLGGRCPNPDWEMPPALALRQKMQEMFK